MPLSHLRNQLSKNKLFYSAWLTLKLRFQMDSDRATPRFYTMEMIELQKKKKTVRIDVEHTKINPQPKW